jgi:hypothetical protein
MGTLFVVCLYGPTVFSQTRKPSKALKAQGVLHSVQDGMVILETKIRKQLSQKLAIAGFQVVSTAKEITSRTIYKDRMYVGYGIAKNGPKPGLLKSKIGKNVVLTMRRLENHSAVVTGLK